MGAWMVHGLLAATAFGAAAWLSERALAALGRLSRWPWLAAMLASASWPFASAALRAGEAHREAGTALLDIAPAGGAALPAATPAELAGAVPDLLLLGGWGLASFLFAGVLLLSAEALKDDRRRWRSHRVAGERVYVSARLGPAVVGALRPRIVLPGWVLEADAALQRLIVLHEREHVRAGDTRLLATGLLPLLLLPWCLPLWWQFHRLRLAIETDCDARVRRAGVPAREYAEALLAVARRPRTALPPLAAFSPAERELHRRVRLIVAGPARGNRRHAAPLFAAAAAALSLGGVVAPVPDRPSFEAVMAPLLMDRPGALPDGSLRGDPGQERLAAAIKDHHADAVAAGLPDGSTVWFIADRSGAVARTGIERGSEQEIEARIRSRYPREVSDLGFGWSDVPAAGGASVLWIPAR
jgi:bla regulator protein blaR1